MVCKSVTIVRSCSPPLRVGVRNPWHANGMQIKTTCERQIHIPKRLQRSPERTLNLMSVGSQEKDKLVDATDRIRVGVSPLKKTLVPSARYEFVTVDRIVR